MPKNFINIYLSLILALSSTAINSRELITIGGGGVSGVYFPAAVAICKLMNRNAINNNLRCNPSSTAGSIFNLDKLRGGEFQFALTQSDWQFIAQQGSDQLKDNTPYESLRAVISLYPEPFNVLVKNQSVYQSFNDLKSMRVNFGPRGSGQQATAQILLEVAGWNALDLENITELPSEKQARALCSGQIDAMVYIVGHPSHAINEAVEECGARLLPVEEVTINRLISQYPFYRKVSIPGDMYLNNPDNILTFGVGATLVTDSNVNDETVYQLVSSVLDNLALFKKLHPAFEFLETREMVQDSLTAPIHIGAQRYFDEHNL